MKLSTFTLLFIALAASFLLVACTHKDTDNVLTGDTGAKHATNTKPVTPVAPAAVPSQRLLPDGRMNDLHTLCSEERTVDCWIDGVHYDTYNNPSVFEFNTSTSTTTDLDTQSPLLAAITHYSSGRGGGGSRGVTIPDSTVPGVLPDNSTNSTDGNGTTPPPPDNNTTPIDTGNDTLIVTPPTGIGGNNTQPIANTPFVNLTFAPGFPVDQNVVLTCENNLTGTVLYDWDFNDPNTNYVEMNSNAQSHYWTYSNAGTFTPTCTAHNGTSSANSTLQVAINTPVLGLGGLNPYAMVLTFNQPRAGVFNVHAVTVGFRPDATQCMYTVMDGSGISASFDADTDVTVAPANYSVTCRSYTFNDSYRKAYWEENYIPCNSQFACVTTQKNVVVDVQ